MTLKIEKVADRQKTIIRLSGRLQCEHLNELRRQVDGEHSPSALDLEGVTLVDIEAVGFLNACEKNGVELLHCWPYIREWMTRENAEKDKALRCCNDNNSTPKSTKQKPRQKLSSDVASCSDLSEV